MAKKKKAIKRKTKKSTIKRKKIIKRATKKFSNSKKAKKILKPKKNLNANAEKGSLFKTIGSVVIKADDQSKTNIRGKN